MSTRISTAARYAQLTADMKINMFNFNKLTTQLASGKKYSDITENPIAAVNIVNTNRQLGQIETFEQNVELASSELSALDDLMELARGYLQTAWDKGLQANNQTYKEGSLKALKAEIDEITKTMVDLANTEYNDNYIFAGANTKTIPFEYNEETGEIIYNGTPADNPDYIRQTEVADGVFETINTTGDRIFGYYKIHYKYEASDGSDIYEEDGKYYYAKTYNHNNPEGLTPTAAEFTPGAPIYKDVNTNEVVVKSGGNYYTHETYTGDPAQLREVPPATPNGNTMYVDDATGKSYGKVEGMYIAITEFTPYGGAEGDLSPVVQTDADGAQLYTDADGNVVTFKNGIYEYQDKVEYPADKLVAVELEDETEAVGVMGALRLLSKSIGMVLDAEDAESEQEGYKLMLSTMDMFADSHTQILTEQTKFGGVANRLEMSESTLSTSGENLTAYLKDLNEVDYASAVTQWLNAQYAYQASMQIAASTMNISLLNYL